MERNDATHAADESTQEATREEHGEAPKKRERERSTIAFPYDDLESAESVVKALHSGYGGRANREQIAAELGVSANSGSFRTKLSTARLFGYVEAGRQSVELTQLGRRLLDEQTRAEARVEGFLNVPLYEALYERFKGVTLPQSKGLEEVIRGLGVASKQVPVARQAFQRSAQQAGFFDKGEDRLVLPHTGKVGKEDQADHSLGRREEPEEEPGMQADPLLASLFRRLPPPEKGFSQQERENFMTALQAIFTIVYGSTSEEGGDERGAPEQQGSSKHPIGPDRSAQGLDGGGPAVQA